MSILKNKKADSVLAWAFLGLTLLFIFLSMTNSVFLEWVFMRHQNQWSWYIRPFFLIPFCLFSYKHSVSGVSITVFCLFTSMCWFDQPEIISNEVQAFLQYEKDWLTGFWNIQKVAQVLLIPISFFILGYAFWTRSLWVGLVVITGMAMGKVYWSLHSAGESGKSILLPALIGLGICLVLIYYFFKRFENKNSNKVKHQD